MKKYMIFTLLSCVAFFSCTHQELDPQAFVPENASGLIIQASCDDGVKTDISEGVSVWEAGDVITVVYDGTAYTYTTASGGATAVFTSTAGIPSYDSTKELVAYYPATTAAGTISLPAEKTVAFVGSTQTTVAQAPLVGTPNDTMTDDGVLRVGFRNICSVLELRLDGGSITDAPKSLTISPASTGDFDGYMAFTGTVDKETHAITTTSTATTLKLNFPSGTSLTQDMTLKIPVGRFTASHGLLLTMETTTGKSYEKVIYREGLQSYELNNDRYVAKHFAKPMYAFSAGGNGIGTAEELVAFAKAVNENGDWSPYMDENGVVFLRDNIDMSSVTSWTPIGVCSAELTGNTLLLSGNPFRGKFDGKGYEIRNFKMTCTNATAASPWGLFGGIANGAEVKNITFASSCSLTVSPSVQTDCGILAGVVHEATVSNVVNYAPMTYTNATVADNKRMTMGMIGVAYADTQNTLISGLVNHGAITADTGNNKQNNANAVHVAGICAFSTAFTTSSSIITVDQCVNNGDITGNTGRASGIVAACQRSTHMTNCTNRGHNNSTSTNARLGNLTCITGAGSVIMDSANYGDIISSQSQPVGGCVCLVNQDDNCFVRMANYGRVITDRTSGYTGTLFGQCNKAATFVNCIAAGNYGTYNEGSYAMVGLNKSNYFQYVGAHSTAATGVTSANITFDGVVSIPQSISILAIGNSFSIDAMEYLYDILKDAGVKTIVLGNLYRASCTLEMHDGFFTDNSTSYTYYKNTSGEWTKTASTAPFTALEERSWDYISMQQGSPYSGQPETYDPHLDNLIDFVTDECPSSKLMWHMTWAFQSDSPHAKFYFYDNDQMIMYNAIISTVKSTILTNNNFSLVIPCGTAIQNVRTSFMGDTMTRDGHHLSYREGRFVAALTWAAKILGCDLDDITYTPAESTEYTYTTKDVAAIKEAVKNAVERPYVITQSSY